MVLSVGFQVSYLPSASSTLLTALSHICSELHTSECQTLLRGGSHVHSVPFSAKMVVFFVGRRLDCTAYCLTSLPPIVPDPSNQQCWSPHNRFATVHSLRWCAKKNDAHIFIALFLASSFPPIFFFVFCFLFFTTARSLRAASFIINQGRRWPHDAMR